MTELREVSKWYAEGMIAAGGECFVEVEWVGEGKLQGHVFNHSLTKGFDFFTGCKTIDERIARIEQTGSKKCRNKFLTQETIAEVYENGKKVSGKCI